MTVTCFIQAGGQSFQLLGTSHERCPLQHRGRVVAFVQHLGNSGGRGNTLKLQLAEIAEVERLPRRQQVCDHLAAQNLAARRTIAQPARDHERHAEITAFTPQHFAEMNPDANLEARACYRSSRGLLDTNRAAHRVGRRRERSQHTVAQPLELLPATTGDRIAYQLMMSLEEPLAGLIADRLQNLGGIDQVAEQQRFCA